MIQYRDRATSIVVVGVFAPARFHPEWFLRNRLLTQEDLDEVVITTVGPGATQWLHPRLGELLVLPDRVSFTCRNEALWMAARDFVAGIISLDPGNIISALGINLHMVAVFEGDDASSGVWNALGDVFAPKGLWRDALALPDKDGYPGLEGIKLSVPDADPDLSGSRRIFAFEPVLATLYKLAILVNNHFDITRACLAKKVSDDAYDVFLGDTADVANSVELVIQLLAERYEVAISESRAQAEKVLSTATRQARSDAAMTALRRASGG